MFFIQLAQLSHKQEVGGNLIVCVLNCLPLASNLLSFVTESLVKVGI